MAIALRGSSTGLLNSASQTITLPVTTNAGDCIVMCCSIAGTSQTASGTGAGATWVVALTQNPGTLAACSSLVGYAATAGQTTFTLSASGNFGGYCCAVFSGVKTTGSPVLSAAGNNPISTLTITTSSASYTPGQLVVACACTFIPSGAWHATTWSNGATTTSLGAFTNSAGSGRACAADAVIETGAGSTTATFTWDTDTNNANAGIVVLSPPPPPGQGNMLAVIGL